MKRWKRRVLHGLGALATLVAIPHAATQFAYTTNLLYHQANPSEMRQEFQREFGIELRGWSKDIEESPERMCRIAEAVAREKAQGDFRMPAFTIEPKEYHKKNVLMQLEHVFRPNGGTANPVTEKVKLGEHNDDIAAAQTAVHEIKHIKTFKALDERPEFRERWESLVRASGASYRSLLDQERYMLRGTRDTIRSHQEECQKEGFITCYAKQNFFEDVAELAQEVEAEGLRNVIRSDRKSIGMILQEQDRRFLDKIELLQEYRIIPPEFLEVWRLNQLHHRGMGYHDGYDTAKVWPFVEQSRQFLERYPQSVYVGAISHMRGLVLSQAGESRIFSEDFERGQKDYDTSKARVRREAYRSAIAEWHRGLAAPYKDPMEYVSMLSQLKELTARLECGAPCEARSAVYQRAMDLLEERLKEPRFDVFRVGADDYLRSKGVPLDAAQGL